MVHYKIGWWFRFVSNSTSRFFQSSVGPYNLYLEAVRLDEWTLKQRKQIDKKGTAQLPPKSHEKYEKWLKDNKRRIIINKERKMQVLNFQAKSLTTLTKKCLILELHLNEDSSLWRLRAGNGELFKLSLLQGIQGSTDIPKELDCDAGWVF